MAQDTQFIHVIDGDFAGHCLEVQHIPQRIVLHRRTRVDRIYEDGRAEEEVGPEPEIFKADELRVHTIRTQDPTVDHRDGGAQAFHFATFCNDPYEALCTLWRGFSERQRGVEK